MLRSNGRPGSRLWCRDETYMGGRERNKHIRDLVEKNRERIEATSNSPLPDGIENKVKAILDANKDWSWERGLDEALRD